MNKSISDCAIVIIGNGFDLAHGLKTSYSDFADWYIEKKIAPEIRLIFNGILRSKKNESKLIREDFINRFFKSSYGGLSSDLIIGLLRCLRIEGDDDAVVNFLKSKRSYINELLSNKFLCKMYSDNYSNWFDIENAYFFELKKILHIYTEDSLQSDANELYAKNDVITLNNEFNEVKGDLKEYLKTITPQLIDEVRLFFNKNFIIRFFKDKFYLQKIYLFSISVYSIFFIKRYIF